MPGKERHRREGNGVRLVPFHADSGGPSSGKSGEHNVQAPKGNTGNSQWKHIRLALYLCKYVTKELETGEAGEVIVGRHRYRASLGIEDPVERRIFPAETGPEAVVEWLKKTGVVGYQATFGDGKAGWMCSWSFGM